MLVLTWKSSSTWTSAAAREKRPQISRREVLWKCILIALARTKTLQTGVGNQRQTERLFVQIIEIDCLGRNERKALSNTILTSLSV